MGLLQHLGAVTLTPQLHQEMSSLFAQEVGQLSLSSTRLQCCHWRSNSASFENLRMRLRTSHDSMQRERGCVVVRAANRIFKRTRPERKPSVGVILRNLSSNGANPVRVLEKEARFLESADWFAILEGLGKQQKWLLALEVFRWMQQQKWYKPDSGFYSKLISIMGKAKQLRLAMWLFGEIRRNGVRPDTSLYNSIISAHIHSRDRGRGFEKALKFLEEMKTKPNTLGYLHPHPGYEVSREYCQLVIAMHNEGAVQGFGSSHLISTAQCFLLPICLPNIVTYNILLRASAQACQFEQVEGFFKEMETARIKPDIYSYNGIIDAYGKAGEYLQMENMLSWMRGEHCRPDLVTYNTLIDAYGRGRAFSKMEQVLKSMLGAKSRHKPDLKTYHSLMCNYARAGEVEKMEWSLSRMDATHYKPDLITFEIFIMGYGHVGAFNKMRGCVDRMLDLDIRPELTTLNALISAYCDHSLLEEAEALLSKAKDWHIHPQVSSYLLILRAYSKESRKEDVERLLERMRGAGVLPNRETFMEVLDTFGLTAGSEKLMETETLLQEGEDGHAT